MDIERVTRSMRTLSAFNNDFGTDHQQLIDRDIQEIDTLRDFSRSFRKDYPKFHETLMAKLLRWKPDISGGDKKVGDLIVVYQGNIFVSAFFVAPGTCPGNIWIDGFYHNPWRWLGPATPEHIAEAGDTRDCSNQDFIPSRAEREKSKEYEDTKEPEDKDLLYPPCSDATLHEAAMENDVPKLLCLLKNGADIDARTNDWHVQTALHIAAQQGHLAILALLLEKGADVDALMETDDSLHTALHIAAEQGHVGMVDMLLYFKADVNGTHSSNRYREGHPDESPLHLAAEGNHLQVVKHLIRSGAALTEAAGLFQTALHYAAKNGHLEVAEFLIETAPELLESGSRLTPLLTTLAANSRDSEKYIYPMVKLLLDKGASLVVLPLHSTQWTPLQVAISEHPSSFPVVALLVERGADIEAMSSFRSELPLTPLLWAIDREGSFRENFPIVRLLVESGAKLEAADRTGKTPLIYAAGGGEFAGDLPLVKFLIEKGADVKAKDFRGKTAIDYARGEIKNFLESL